MVAHFRHFPGGAEQNPAASFQWGNSAETGLYFHAESHFQVERQNWLSGAQSVLGTEQDTKHKCWKQWSNLSTGSTPCCHYKRRCHFPWLGSVYFCAKSTTESAFYEHSTLLYWHRTMTLFLYLVTVLKSTVSCKHHIINITVINNSKPCEPLLRVPLKAQSLQLILAHLVQMLKIF